MPSPGGQPSSGSPSSGQLPGTGQAGSSLPDGPKATGPQRQGAGEANHGGVESELSILRQIISSNGDDPAFEDSTPAQTTGGETDGQNDHDASTDPFLVFDSGSGQSTGISAPEKNATAAGSGDRSAQLEATLNQSLVEFDEYFRQQQKSARAEATSNREGDPASGTGSQGDTRSTPGIPEFSVPPSPATSGVHNAEKGKSNSSNSGKSGGSRNGANPEDIPDGNDDDVVARQIREAAEQETNPELKAKLWEEYKRYKGIR